MEDAYWQTLIAGYSSDDDPPREREEVKIEYTKWSSKIRKHAYLRRLPTALFENYLLLVTCLGLLWHLFKITFRFRGVPPTASTFGRELAKTDGRKLMKTRLGYLGLADEKIEVNDHIVICKGGKLPLVIRKNKHGDDYEFICDCYIHGVMQGEAFREQDCEDIWLC